MKTAKKALLLTVCALVLVAATIMGTVAFLTSTDKVVNTFAVGKLAIELDEAKTNDNGDGTVVPGVDRVKENGYKLVPGHHYTKDPVVHLAANSEACYVFIDVNNELIGAIKNGHYNAEGTDGFYTPALGILEQITELNGWNPIMNPKTGKTMFYKAIDAATAKAGVDLPVFGYFDVDSAKTQTQLEAYEGKTITVTAYACQQDGFASAEAAFTACFGK